jgi:hypothetical protein
MKLLVGHTRRWDEAYGEIPDIEDYDLDKSMAAESLLDDVEKLITLAKQRGGPAKLLLVLEPDQGSAVIGAIYQIQAYDLTKSMARYSLIHDIRRLVKKAKIASQTF